MRRLLLAVPALLATISLAVMADSATITWGTTTGHGAIDSGGNYLPGTATLTENFSAGAYVQLVKLVGQRDPFDGTIGFVGDDGSGTNQDILLDATHVGYKYPPTIAHLVPGCWSAADRTVSLTTSDIGSQVYVRVFNVPRDDVTADVEVGYGRLTDPDDPASYAIVTQTIGDFEMTPQKWIFDDIQTIPEPASLLFIIPGLAIWALRRKK
jgi:hypothetical protein